MLQAFFDLKLKTKLLLVSAIILAIFLIGNLLIATKVSLIKDELDNFSQINLGIAHSLSQASRHSLKQTIAFERLILERLGRDLDIALYERTANLEQTFRELGAVVTRELNTARTLIQRLGLVDENLARIEQVALLHNSIQQNALQYLNALTDDRYRDQAGLLSLIAREQDMRDQTLTELLAAIDRSSAQTIATIADHESDIIGDMAFTFVIAGALSFAIFLVLATKTSEIWRKAIAFARDIAQGNYAHELEVSAHDESGELIKALNDMRSHVIIKMQTERDEVMRLKQALDNVSASIMVADNDRNIIYTNRAVIATLRNAEEDLRKDLPNFNVDKLVGGSIDQFHVNPLHQKTILDSLTKTHRAQIEVGGRHMLLIINPVINATGERFGSVVEWIDMTEQVLIQRELDGIIESANDGQLDRRINLEGKSDFYLQISNGLNHLLDGVSEFVHEMGGVFASMAAGQLDHTIKNSYQGEFANIKLNANSSLVKLNDVMSKIRTSAKAVKVSAREVAQGSDDLSRRTESQASALEQTAASMEEITSTVKQTSENANEANQLAHESRIKAEQGGSVVQEAIYAMNEILTASKKINDIISVIDDIAFQTNLLALNAAVEAARAGEQGRGFAVVAAEVRTLSQRSAAAAKEIKDLIRDSVNKVESGSILVNRSGETLAELVSSVERVAAMINDVSIATREQNAGIAQINQAIAEMDGVTQQNAALVEQTSAAGRSMSEEAENMNRLLDFFYLNEADTQVVQALPESLPIRRYEPEKHKPAEQKGHHGGGAATFSSDEEWEDF